MKLNIDEKDLRSAVERQIITEEQSRGLWSLWSGTQREPSRGMNVLAFMGALIIIGSMTWFATKTFFEADPWALLLTSVSYFILFTAAGLSLQKRMASQVPAMLLFTIAIFMTPLTVFTVQRLLNSGEFPLPGSYHDFYVWIDKGWFFIEISTIAMSLLFLKLFRFELFVLPLSFTLWFLSMDLTPLLFGKEFNWENSRIVSVYFGLAMLVVSYLLDLFRKTRDYSFWLYLFGLLTFWCGLSFSSTDQLLLKGLYCALNLLLIVISVLFRRVVFLVFGSLGVFLFLSDLAGNVFRDSLFFPIVLSAVGGILLAASIVLLKRRGPIEAFFEKAIPAQLKALIPKNNRA